MRKVLILNSLYSPNIGGVENSMRELSNQFLKMGFQVDIICSDSNFTDGEQLPAFQRDGSLRIFRYKSSGESYFEQFDNCKRLIRELYLDENYDYVISRGYVTSYCAYRAGIRDISYLVPSVIFFQNFKFLYFRSITKLIKYLGSSVIQILSFYYTNIFVFSESMARQVGFFTFSFKDISLVKPGVNIDRFFPVEKSEKLNLRTELGLPISSKFILCLGRFSEVKQFDVVISAMLYLDESFKLLLVGNGPELSSYKDIIKSNKLDDRVFIYSSTNTPEKFYRVADVFAMTSRYEAFGQVLIEATATSLPVVAFKPGLGINTSLGRIYNGYNSLVTYASESTPIALAEAISESYSKGINHSYLSERDKFLTEYSWFELAKKLIVTKSRLIK